MIDYLKHNDYEEMDIDNSFNDLFNCLDVDTLITLYFYADMLISFIDTDK